jgi:hypothetical protein
MIPKISDKNTKLILSFYLDLAVNKLKSANKVLELVF